MGEGSENKKTPDIFKIIKKGTVKNNMKEYEK